jgi:short-subunit dehydrogenase
MSGTEKVAIVTGASSGIGLATTRKLAARGVRVALVARTESRLNEIAAELGTASASAFPLDVTDRAALQSLPERVVEKFGRLDIVVNNAGVNHRGSVAERTGEELASIIETNLVAPILLSRAALPHLKKNGCIVNVASLAGKIPLPHEATYSSSKWGLRAFSRALDFELAERGIRVCAVNPGPVDTGFFGDARDVPDIVFSQPMSTADQIADAVLRAIDGEANEIDVPLASGKLCTLGYLFPSVFMGLRPLLEKRGAKNKERFLASRQGGGAS